MTGGFQQCPIWGGTDGVDVVHISQTNVYRVENSPRAGSGYVIRDVIADSDVKSMTDAEKARLTTWLIDQRELGTPMPEVTHKAIQDAKNRRSLPVDERAHRLLRLIARYIDQVGKKLSISRKDVDFYGWTESL